MSLINDHGGRFVIVKLTRSDSFIGELEIFKFKGLTIFEKSIPVT